MKTIDPFTVEYADQKSLNPAEQFPIMSISKSFCGAVCALMAAENIFGKKGLNASLAEVLEKAKNPAIGNVEKIEKFLEMLRQKNLQDVTIADLLTHKSGIPDIVLSPERGADDGDRLSFFADQIPPKEEGRAPQFSYSNTGYEMLEEIINLTSNKGGYLNELRARILIPLNINQSTGPVLSSPAAIARIGVVHIAPQKEAPFKGKSAEFRQYIPLELHHQKQGSLAAGALCSTISDMEIYARELAKMVARQDSKLTENLPKEAREAIGGFYRQNRGENPAYSLGLAIVDNGRGNCVITKGGRFPGNKSDMAIIMPFSLDQFLRGETEMAANQELPTLLYMQQRCFEVDKLNDLYQDSLRQFFSALDPELEKKFLTKNEDQKPQNNEWRKSLNQWRDELISSEKLPESFRQFQEQLCDNFGKATQNIYQYLQDENAGHTAPEIADFRDRELQNAFAKMEPELQPKREQEFLANLAQNFDSAKEQARERQEGRVAQGEHSAAVLEAQHKGRGGESAALSS